MAFQMVDADQRFLQGVGESLGIAQAHQQRARQTRALGDGEGVDGLVGAACIFEGFANDRNDGAQMLARSQLRHHAAVGLVGGDLRVDDVRDQLFAGAHDGRRRLVARALDAEDVNVAHTSIVRGDAQGNGLSSKSRMKEHATNIVRELRQRGFQAYFAGGCVRDTLLGLAPADYDVATDATPPR